MIDYGVSREELVRQVTWFCLRGIGLKEEAIQRCYQLLEMGEPGTAGERSTEK